LEYIKFEYPNLELHLILGTDTFHDIVHKKWKDSDRLLNSHTIHVIARKSEEKGSRERLKHNLTFPDPILHNVFHHKVHYLSSISSTKIRSLVPPIIDIWPLNVHNELLKSVDSSVYEYIRAHHLFGFTESFYCKRTQWAVFRSLCCLCVLTRLCQEVCLICMKVV